MSVELQKTFDPQEKKRQLHLDPDVILDIEIIYALKVHNMSEGLDIKDAGLMASRTFNKFRVFLDINFKNKYMRMASPQRRQKPGPDFATYCLKPALADFLSRIKNVEHLRAGGFEEVEFNNVEFAAIKECFLQLFSKEK